MISNGVIVRTIARGAAWAAMAVMMAAVCAMPASAQSCLSITSPFVESFQIGVTGSSGNKYSLSLERLTFTTRTASGSALIQPDSWLFTWDYTFPGGSIGWYCEIEPRTGTGTGAVTQIFTGDTINQGVDCSIGPCAGAALGRGEDVERP